MADKTEYSRLLLKRTGIPGEVPTYTTGTTLNDMIPTDLFVGEMYLNTVDDLLWVRTDNGILPIALSGMTGTSIPTLIEVLGEGNITGGFDIYVSSGTTIQYEGLNSGTTTTLLGLDSSGNTITTVVAAATQDLDNVLSYGNSTGSYDIVVSSGQTIQYQGLSNGSTTTILGLDSSGNTITTTVNSSGGGGGGGQVYYFNLSNSQSPYYELSTSATTSVETSISATTGNTQTAYIGGFMTPSTLPHLLNMPAGILSFYLHANTDFSTATFDLYAELYKRTTGGTETLLYTSDIVEVNQSTTEMYVLDGFFTGATLDLSDRLVVKLLATNTSNTTRTIVFSTEGSQHYSFFITTIPVAPRLDQVLSEGNFTGNNNIVVSQNQKIQSPNNENEIYLQSSGSMGLQSIYTLGGNNITEQIKMRAASGSDAGIEIQSYDSTNILLTRSEYRPSSIRDLSFDSGGSFVETRLESSGFTIDLSNTSAGYLTIDGLLTGSSVNLLGIDSNNRVVPYTIPNTVDSITTGTGLSANTTTGNITITNTIVNGSFGITIDGGGSAITTGVKGYITIPYDCTITGWDILADVSGSIVVDVWKDTYANFPPTVADTIAGSEKPTLSSQVKNQDNSLSTWTTSVSSGDIIGFNVDSASTLTRVNLTIKVLKTS